MSWMEIVAERKIREAQEDGQFDNLPGQGQPLDLDLDRRVPAEQRLAYGLMRDASILPEWIQLDKEIRTRLALWDTRREQFVADRRREMERREPSRERDAFLDTQRDRFLIRAAEALRELNRMIDRLNLVAPTPAQQRLRLNAGERLQELEECFPRLGDGGDTPVWASIIAEHRPPTRLANRMPLRRRKESLG